MTSTGKLRPCPALGKGITSAECGLNRNSQIACTADCPFNPFAVCNYDVLLKLEEELDQQCLNWLVSEKPLLFSTLQKSVGSNPDRKHFALNAAITKIFFFDKDENSTTSAQRMESARGGSMRNDHRSLLRAKMRTEVRLLEVHRVLNEQLTEAVDLLSPNREPFLVLDRSLASNSVRFTTLMAFAFPMPHFVRLAGAAYLIPPTLEEFEADEVVREIAVHMGGPAHGDDLRRWLAEHYVEFIDAVANASLVRYRMMIDSMDVKIIRAVYELAKPYDECKQTLDCIPEVEPDDLLDEERRAHFSEGRVWFQSPQKSANAAQHADEAASPKYSARPVLGRVIMGPTHWCIEAITSAKYKDLRERFERVMGDRARFMEDRIIDPASNLMKNQPAGDPSKVPPRLMENPSQISFSSSRVPVSPDGMEANERVGQYLEEEQDKLWLETPLDILGGLSPRQAACDEKWRPKLLHVMKNTVRRCDEQNKEKGTNRDVNWMLSELGLTEILFEPPPIQPPAT